MTLSKWNESEKAIAETERTEFLSVIANLSFEIGHF
jgi:hypothetical protein